MLLAVGMLAALLERERSGRGQVVDAAMVDGAALLATFLHGLRGSRAVAGPSGARTCSTAGRPFYDVYETADGGYMAVGALEPQFYAELLAGLGLADDPDCPPSTTRAAGPSCAGGSPSGSPSAPGTSGRRSSPTGRLRRAGARPRRGARAPAQRRPRHLRRGRRRGPAGPGAPLRPHADRRPTPAPDPERDVLPVEDILTGWPDQRGG